jgi:hypothetical protein
MSSDGSPVKSLLTGRIVAEQAVKKGNYSILNKFAYCESSKTKSFEKALGHGKVQDTGLVEFASPKYYALCGVGGILSCGLTHTAIVPLDLVKCRIQVNPAKYQSKRNSSM